jgi:hypothetical protein
MFGQRAGTSCAAWRLSSSHEGPLAVREVKESKVKLSRTSHTGAKGEMSYSSYSLLTSALDGDE